jgi:hypothetical protein
MGSALLASPSVRPPRRDKHERQLEEQDHSGPDVYESGSDLVFEGRALQGLVFDRHRRLSGVIGPVSNHKPVADATSGGFG